jgi:hypothetical protein
MEKGEGERAVDMGMWRAGIGLWRASAQCELRSRYRTVACQCAVGMGLAWQCAMRSALSVWDCGVPLRSASCAAGIGLWRASAQSVWDCGVPVRSGSCAVSMGLWSASAQSVGMGLWRAIAQCELRSRYRTGVPVRSGSCAVGMGLWRPIAQCELRSRCRTGLPVRSASCAAGIGLRRASAQCDLRSRYGTVACPSEGGSLPASHHNDPGSRPGKSCMASEVATEVLSSIHSTDCSTVIIQG